MKRLGKINISKMNIGGYIIFAVGLFLSFFLLRTLINDVPVWFFGRLTTAIIDEVWYENFNEDNQYPDYYIKFHFETSKGETIYSVSSVPESTWAMYAPGQETRVKYFPLVPSNNRLYDSRIAPFLICSNTPFLLLCWFLIATGRELIRE